MQIRRQFGLSARHTDEVAAGGVGVRPIVADSQTATNSTSRQRSARWLLCSLSFHSIPSQYSTKAPTESAFSVSQIGNVLDMSAERKA